MAQFSRYVVGSLKGVPAETVQYRYSPAADPITHYIMDFTPGASYDVDTSKAGQVIIQPTKAPTAHTVKATEAGLLIFQTAAQP